MPKVIFILQRKAGTTHEECLARWAGDQHTRTLRDLPGLVRWTQNHVIPGDQETPCDGIGELWFESDEHLRNAMQSPEMGAAIEDAKTFLDMEKTKLIFVDEKTVLERAVT
jgi:uncharacterized protein (TIGR02118 family)